MRQAYHYRVREEYEKTYILITKRHPVMCHFYLNINTIM